MKALIAIGIVGLSSLSLAAQSEPLQCQAGMKKALAEGHFSGALFCSRSDVTLVLAGRTSGHAFSIYDYRYRFLPKGGNVMHGGQRMLVFHHGKYVGQFTLSPPPFSTVAVQGATVVVKQGREKDVLDFSHGPPKTAFVNEENQTFYR